MQDIVEVDQKVSDAQLIALVRTVQVEIETHAEPIESYLLLRDFARELLRQRLLLRVQFVQMMELHRPEQGIPT
jgi:hypothetical protein